MTAQYLPDIGATGVYVLKPPFATLLKANTQYRCEAVRRLKDLLALSEDPCTDFYLNNGLTQENYNNDLTDNVCIVSLQSGIGEWIYVPHTYIVSFPMVNGYTYYAKVLGFSLGPIYASQDLSSLKTAMANLCRDYTGIDSVVKEIIVSSAVILSSEDAAGLETARAARKAIAKSDVQRIRELEALVQELTTKKNALEDYIKAHLP